MCLCVNYYVSRALPLIGKGPLCHSVELQKTTKCAHPVLELQRLCCDVVSVCDGVPSFFDSALSPIDDCCGKAAQHRPFSVPSLWFLGERDRSFLLSYHASAAGVLTLLCLQLLDGKEL